MNKVITPVALAALFGFACIGAASAVEATGSVNVRSGPSTSYAVLDTLYAGETVEVEECTSSGWCLIEHSGPDGWVSARYLTNDTDDTDERPVVRSSPSISLSFSFGRGNGYSMGGPRGNSRDLVCLVTFGNRSQVAGGADADVRRAQVMPRAQAERLDRPNDSRAIYDYGTNQQTRSTCEYLNNLN
ncbi:MAG: SH3 domain-containing protein [Hyphomicrobiales bacterium]|nr:MAG: SH3 domain-containing protein [Hyphomicrobiales bacterium]